MKLFIVLTLAIVGSSVVLGPTPLSAAAAGGAAGAALSHLLDKRCA